MGNSAFSDNILIQRAVERLAARLPPGWRVVKGPSRARRGPFDAVLKISGPAKNAGSVLVEAKTRLEPRDVDYLAVITRPTADQPVLIIAPFLSPRTQERLTARGFGYADLSGNVRLSVPMAGLFLETSGARENPAPTARERKSLRGAKAGRLIRALSDFRPPVGLRELAKRADVDPGYTSRVVDVLNREALVVRTARGPITEVDWPGLLRRWSQAYSPFQRQSLAWYLAARGLAPATEKLKTVSARYVVSGSWAATQFAPVAPTRLFLCYADDPEALAGELDLRPTEAGANVALVTPYDPIVYERTSRKKGVTVAALSQIAVDLLTSPGRGPNEGEALIEWMRANEHVWRT
jgi:hypothetical protein